MDANEADSGVGSDMANPLEREETVDSQTSDNYQPTEKSTEPDEDSEALEKTCRETIENLRRLGEQTRYSIFNFLFFFFLFSSS